MTTRRAIPAVVTAVWAALVNSSAPAGTVEYTVTFESTWSAATHPIDFPPNPHFSGLIGGTHDDQVTFWMEGELASPGIQNMAENGNKSPLDSEVQAAIDAGTAGAIISGGGISPSPGMVSETFEVEDAYPLVTLVSMLAPSPDWFVGVAGLSLRDQGEWVDELVVDLHVYDAGTDSGPSYLSPNQPTNPPVPIFEHMFGPFASDNFVGTFTFVRTDPVAAPEVAPLAGRPQLVTVGPNPFRGATRFSIRVPAGIVGELSVHGVDGRRVRSLFRGTTSGEPSVVSWDGRGAAGAPVASGVYYVSLRTGTDVRSQRVVVTR